MRIIINWVISAVAIAITAYLLPGVEVDSLTTALVLAVVLGGINAFVRPILIILTLPLTILTFGLFVLILNALLIMLSAAVVPGFIVAGFWSAFLFAIILSLVHSILDGFKGSSDLGK